MDSLGDQQTGAAPKNTIRIVSTNTATFSDESKRAIRSHAMAWSRRKRKEAKERQQSDSRSPTSEASTTAGRIEAQANDFTNTAVASSHEGRLPTHAIVRRPRGSLGSLGQSVMQVPPRHKLPHRLLLTEDENAGQALVKYDVQLGRVVYGDENKAVRLDAEPLTGDSTGHPKDKKRVEPGHPVWTLRTPPDNPSPATPLDTGHFASFATTAVPIDYKMAFLLNFFSTVIVQRIDLKSAMIHAYTTLLVPMAVEEPALLYAILLRTLTEFRSGGGSKPDQIVGPQTAVMKFARCSAESEYVQFKLQAIQHLRRGLGSDGGFVNSAMIHAIAILLRAETPNGELQDIRAHLMGLRQMQALGHSLNGIPGSISGPHLQSINLACAMTRTAPPFASTVTEGARFLISARRKFRNISEPVLKLMASAFNNPETASLIGDRLLLYATRHQEFVLLKHLISTGEVSASDEDLELVFDVHHLADYHLLSLPFETQLLPIQESTRLALYISAWVNTLNFEPGLAYTVALTRQLQMALQRLKLFAHRPSTLRLLTWELFVGAHISRAGAERAWFVQHLAGAILLLGLEYADQLRELLFEFFYMENIYGGSLPQIWVEVRLAAQAVVTEPSNRQNIETTRAQN